MFDIHLCTLIKANFDFATQHGHWMSPGLTNYSRGPHADCRPAPSVYLSYTPVGKEPMSHHVMESLLTPDIVWDIVTRWGAMQLLAEIYMGGSIKDRFVEGVGNHPWEPTMGQNTNLHDCRDPPAYHGDIGIISGMSIQRNLGYVIRGRFYRAVIAIWLMQESCQLFKMTRWETLIELADAEHQLRSFSPCTTNFAIQEDIDALELLEFFRNWCIPRIFASPGKVSQCVAGNDMLLRSSEGPIYWRLHMNIMKQILRPADVLELLVVSANRTHNRLFPNQKYLRLRGAFECVQWTKYYWPTQLGLDLDQWRIDKPGLKFHPDLRLVEADPAWLERDIIRRLISARTQQADSPSDRLVPEKLRFEGPHNGYWSPLRTSKRFSTDLSPFSSQDDELARRQYRTHLVFDFFRTNLWPKEIRGRVFEKEERTEAKDLARTLERVRLTDEYQKFAEKEYDRVS